MPRLVLASETIVSRLPSKIARVAGDNKRKYNSNLRIPHHLLVGRLPGFIPVYSGGTDYMDFFKSKVHSCSVLLS